jgi:uncharacterized membrane-anchored protein
MKMLRIVIFAVVALLQLSVPASMIWNRERTLKQGRVWKFRTAPVDPVDAIRGRYIALRFDAETISRESPSEQLGPGTSVYVILKEDMAGFAQAAQIKATPAQGDNVVKAEKGSWFLGADHVRFPFDRFWVTEKNAPAAESAYIENSRREKQNAYVTVRVLNGDAAIEELFIDDLPLKDYLRAHAPK